MFIAAQVHAQSAVDEASIESKVAMEIQRLALLELRMQPSPTPDDYRIAYHTLRLAQQLMPDDVELARKIAAAAWSTADPELLVSATRDLVRLDPTDTVAQLRLIVAGIARYQTVEQRLAAYERFLGPAGERLRPEVRSRLALDAALLLREKGDERGFVRRLQQAMDLDGSNKAAAQVAMTYFASNVDDPVGRFEMELNVLYADPIDPQLHLAIAHDLANEGMISQSHRFFSHAMQLFYASGDVPSLIELEALAMQWYIEGPEAVLKGLNATLKTKRADAQARRDVAIANGLSLEGLPDPEQVRLEKDMDQLRILCAMQIGDQESLRAAMTDLERSIMYAVGQLNAPETRPPGFDDAAALRTQITLLIELQMYRLWADLDREQVDQQTEAYQTQLRDLQARLTAASDGSPQAQAQIAATVEAYRSSYHRPITPWISLRDGNYEQAIAQADAAKDALGQFADVIKALALEQLDRKPEAARVLMDASRANALSGFSAWARAYALKLDPTIQTQTATGKAIDAMARSVPRFIDDMVVSPMSFMDLRVDVGSPVKKPTDRFLVKVTIKNLAPIPLGVGSDRPINSRLLLQPHRDSNLGFFFGQLYPEVVELNRRIRLDPLETIEAVVPVDVGASGVILSLNALNNHRIRWRVLQGFVIGALQSFRPGPQCLGVESDPVELQRLEQQRLSAQETAVGIRSGPTEELYPLVMQARAVLLAWPRRESRPQQIADLLSRALTARLQSGTPMERALLLAMLPPAGLEMNMLDFDLAAVELLDEADFRSKPSAQLLESLVLLTRVSDPESPLFTHARQAPWPELVELAKLLQARLQAGKPSLTRATSVQQLFPPAMVNPNARRPAGESP
ncbi:MAG: hypothetical protein Kow0022_01990 [Phycisphaerales bacterium]